MIDGMIYGLDQSDVMNVQGLVLEFLDWVAILIDVENSWMLLWVGGCDELVLEIASLCPGLVLEMGYVVPWFEVGKNKLVWCILSKKEKQLGVKEVWSMLANQNIELLVLLLTENWK